MYLLHAQGEQQPRIPFDCKVPAPPSTPDLEGYAGLSREQGLKENGVVSLSHVTLVCSPFTQVLLPGKQLLDQLPLWPLPPFSSAS